MLSFLFKNFVTGFSPGFVCCVYLRPLSCAPNVASVWIVHSWLPLSRFLYICSNEIKENSLPQK